VSDPEIIGSAECAVLLDCTVEQVEELARAGEIPGIKIGRPWRFIKADLLAYLAQKARAEADERRSRRQKREVLPEPKPPRRRVPPSLAFARQE
jgi:excisionase family DNA binding protein